MKYVLIHWIESNETSILAEEYVKDKSMLKDPEKEGMVMFGDAAMKAPKAGWKSYLARVLAASDSKTNLMKSELDFLNNGDLETGNDSTVVRFSAKRLQLEETSAGNKKPAKIMKKNKDVKKLAERKAYKQVLSRIGTPVESDESSEEHIDKYMYDSDELPGETPSVPVPASSDKLLQEEVKKLQSEVSRLHKRLPGLIKEAVLAALTETNKKNDINQPKFFVVSNPKTPSPRPSPLATRPSPLATRPSTQSARSSATPSSCSSEEQDVEEMEGSNSPKLMDYIDSVQMGEVIRSPNFKKMTVNLMTAVFERKVLAESSVTGKSKEGRPALDRTKVELIIAFVIKRFPEVTDAIVKSMMAQKCKDLRNSMDGSRKRQGDAGN